MSNMGVYAGDLKCIQVAVLSGMIVPPPIQSKIIRLVLRIVFYKRGKCLKNNTHLFPMI